MFVFTYLMANHFPWSYRYRDELAADWQDLGNAEVKGQRIDEYLRRQDISARDYRTFVARLQRDFPGEPFLIVRFGDHQPGFAKYAIEPALDDAAIGRRIDAADPRYFTTYYAIDTLNFRPADLSSGSERPRCRLTCRLRRKAAGVPLDASFAEQKRIFGRCSGLFYLCANGAEARRFNRLLIDAGMIKRLCHDAGDQFWSVIATMGGLAASRRSAIGPDHRASSGRYRRHGCGPNTAGSGRSCS